MAERQLQFQKASSNLDSAFYDDETMDLRVVFKSGHSGVHPNTTAQEALDFEQASSPGSHYHNNFKAAGKSYNKIG